MAQIEHALGNGIEVSAWAFDEAYGKDAKFLDGLEKLNQDFVCEIPCDFHGWLSQPKVISPPRNSKKRGPRWKRRRVRKKDVSRRVDNLARYSPAFGSQNWQRYRIKDTDRGPEVWEVKWAWFWRKTKDKLPTRQHTLLVCRNVRTGEVKYFLSNRVVGRERVTIHWLLYVAFGRWAIETCFRTAKEELGMDHFEVRGWRCVHRHWYVTQLSYLFCSRLRQQWDDLASVDPLMKLTVEQVRSAVNTYLRFRCLPPPEKQKRFQHEIERHKYHQRRNAQAIKSHTKTRRDVYQRLGIDVDKIKTCRPRDGNQ